MYSAVHPCIVGCEHCSCLSPSPTLCIHRSLASGVEPVSHRRRVPLSPRPPTPAAKLLRKTYVFEKKSLEKFKKEHPFFSVGTPWDALTSTRRGFHMLSVGNKNTFRTRNTYRAHKSSPSHRGTAAPADGVAVPCYYAWSHDVDSGRNLN